MLSIEALRDKTNQLRGVNASTRAMLDAHKLDKASLHAQAAALDQHIHIISHQLDQLRQVHHHRITVLPALTQRLLDTLLACHTLRMHIDSGARQKEHAAYETRLLTQTHQHLSTHPFSVEELVWGAAHQLTSTETRARELEAAHARMQDELARAQQTSARLEAAVRDAAASHLS
jgi:chromosome segregation ATPase